MQNLIRRGIASIVLIAGLGVSPFLFFVFAEEPPKQQSRLDTDQLKAFARVYVEFEKLRDAYQSRLSQSQGEQESEAIQKEARAKIDEVLAKEGLTPESYSQIIKTLNTDGELRAVAMQLIEEERKKS
jgi:NCAIR mutase (PurE)-related protein